MEEIVDRHNMVNRFCKAKSINGYRDVTKPVLVKLANQILGSKLGDMDA